MTVNIFALYFIGTMHDDDTRYWDSPGLYCRTQIPISSIIG